MSTIPDTIPEQLAFCESHWPVWLQAPTQIGATAQMIQDFKALVVDFRGGYDASVSARAASRAATVSMQNARDAALTSAGALVRTIRAYAEQTNNPDVYALAQIPPPAAPTPALAPTKPTSIELELEPNGALTILWKPTPNSSATPTLDASTSGVTYSIFRRLPGETALTLVDTAPARGARRFSSWTDENIPAGASASGGITYAIQGSRSGGGLVGPMSDAFVVTLGMGGGGLTATISPASTSASNVKMAA